MNHDPERDGNTIDTRIRRFLLRQPSQGPIIASRFQGKGAARTPTPSNCHGCLKLQTFPSSSARYLAGVKFIGSEGGKVGRERLLSNCRRSLSLSAEGELGTPYRFVSSQPSTIADGATRRRGPIHGPYVE